MGIAFLSPDRFSVSYTDMQRTWLMARAVAQWNGWIGFQEDWKREVAHFGGDTDYNYLYTVTIKKRMPYYWTTGIVGR